MWKIGKNKQNNKKQHVLLFTPYKITICSDYLEELLLVTGTLNVP